MTNCRIGASDYLLKSLDADVLYEILTQYERGESPVSPGLANKLLQELENTHVLEGISIHKETDVKIDSLSERQKNVLVLVAKGMKYKDIVITFGVTERTIKYYMEMIINKQHMKNRKQEVKYAIQKGIVD
ncbi:MAG: hypothetical protein H6Q68_4066 [Firmicutes bacterium]|nr:hypothetical protein [Bacillota bacterium]